MASPTVKMTMSAVRSRVAFKQVHVQMNPRPRSLAESKLILAALQKFGEVVTFRNLKYDTTNSSVNLDRAALAIFESSDAATRAIEASPLKIEIPPDTTKPPTDPRKLAADPWAVAEANREAADNDNHPDKPRVINCKIDHSHHSHESAVLRNPYHSAYEVLTNSYWYHDLTKSTGIPQHELADGLMSRKLHIPFRIKRRYQAENVRLGATSLMALYKDGLEKNVEAGPSSGSPSSAEKTETAESKVSPKDELQAMRVKWRTVRISD